MSVMSGSVQKNMNAKLMTAASLAIPPETERNRFLAETWPLRQRLVQALNESRLLSELRDTLLPKLISGEIRVPEGFGPDEAGDVAEELVESVSEGTAAATAVA